MMKFYLFFLFLSCGTFGNVLRLPPLKHEDDDHVGLPVGEFRSTEWNFDRSVSFELWVELDPHWQEAPVLRLLGPNEASLVLLQQTSARDIQLQVALQVEGEPAFFGDVRVRQLKVGQWNHLAGIYDAQTGVIQLMANGNQDMSKTTIKIGTKLSKKVLAVALGGSRNGGTFVGKIDEVRLWRTVRPFELLLSGYKYHFDNNLSADIEHGLACYFTFEDPEQLDSTKQFMFPRQDCLINGAAIEDGFNAPTLPRSSQSQQQQQKQQQQEIEGKEGKDEQKQAVDHRAVTLHAQLAPDQRQERQDYHLSLSQSLLTNEKQKAPVAAAKVSVGLDFSERPDVLKCYHDFDIKWHAHVPGPVLGNVCLLDMSGDGRRELIVPTQNALVEVLYASSAADDDDAAERRRARGTVDWRDVGGTRVPGWPAALPRSAFIAAPLAFDATGDGQPEVLVTSQRGHLLFLSHTGVPLLGRTVRLLPLRVRVDWYRHADGSASDPDVAFSLYRHNEAARGASADERLNRMYNSGAKSQDTEIAWLSGQQSVEQAIAILEQDSDWRGEFDQSDDDDDGDHEQWYDDDDAFDDEEEEAADQQRPAAPSQRHVAEPEVHQVFAGVEGGLTDEGLASLALFLPSDVNSAVASAARIRRGHNAMRAPLYDAWFQATAEARARDTDHVWLSPHVLTDPVLRDLDGDGRDELLVPVTYYLEADDEAVVKGGVSRRKYCAVALVILDAATGAMLRRIELDLTTRDTAYAAVLTAPPVVADVDQDGELDIVVATGAGFLYVLDWRGKVKPHYPRSLGALHVAPLVADFDGDGTVEIVAVDDTGSVTCLGAVDGRTRWETQISGHANAAPLSADINGDGALDVVIAGGDRLVWALRASDGLTLRYFPMQLNGDVLAALTLVSLTEDEVCEPPVILAGCTDGFMYAIDGKTGCIDPIHVGGTVLAAPLVDDLDGDGKLEIVAVTQRGDIYNLGTQAKYHPLKTMLTAHEPYRMDQRGIFVRRQRSEVRHISGDSFPLTFEIVDNGPATPRWVYNVRLSMGFSGQVLFQRQYTEPGVYTIIIQAPDATNLATFELMMTDSVGIVYRDSFTLAFNLHSYRLLKHLIALPFLSVAVLLVISLLVTGDQHSETSILKF